MNMQWFGELYISNQELLKCTKFWSFSNHHWKFFNQNLQCSWLSRWQQSPYYKKKQWDIKLLRLSKTLLFSLLWNKPFSKYIFNVSKIHIAVESIGVVVYFMLSVHEALSEISCIHRGGWDRMRQKELRVWGREGGGLFE